MEKQHVILAIDDDERMLKLLSVNLAPEGFRVVTTTDGAQAPRLIESERPSLVFLDLNMPVMDGVETLKKIREVDKTVPVIIISAHVDRLRLNEAGAYDVSGIFYKGDDFENFKPLFEKIKEILM